MAHKFTLVLSREITDEESAMLRDAGAGESTASITQLPTNPDVTVTQLDYDIEGESLAAVIDAGLEAVKAVPDLSVASLSVPAQPARQADAQSGDTIESETIESEAVGVS